MSESTFQAYRSGQGSGIVAYALVNDDLHVQFRSGDVYVFTPTSTGRLHLRVMKQLARAGAGLNTYINRQTRNRYTLKYKRPIDSPQTPARSIAKAVTRSRKTTTPTSEPNAA